MKPIALTATALLGLSACGSSSGDVNPRPATIGFAEVVTIREDIGNAFDLPITDPAALPTGEVNYSGAFVTELIRSEVSAHMAGDITVSVDFANDAANGALTNMNLTTRDNVPIERVDGEILVSGTEDDGAIRMNGEGDLTFTGADGVVGTSTILNVIVLGDVRTNVTGGDTIALDVVSSQAVGDLRIEFISSGASLSTGAVVSQDP